MKKTKRVLIVDDMQGWINFHKEALSKIYGGLVEFESENCAYDGYNNIIGNVNTSYDLVITDLQMELSYEPKHAGEWLVEQIQKLNAYKNTPIIIVSAAYNIRTIAKKLNVKCLPKSNTRDLNTYKYLMDEVLFT